MKVSMKVISGMHGDVYVPEERYLGHCNTLLEIENMLDSSARAGHTGLEVWGDIAEGIYDPNMPWELIRQLRLSPLNLVMKQGVRIIPTHLLSEATRKLARSGDAALLRTGEKVTYSPGIGYRYTHSYSTTAFNKTMIAWQTGEML